MQSRELADRIKRFIALDDLRVTEGLSDAQEDEWVALKESIERVVVPEAPPSSRRASLRVPFDLAVTFENAKGFSKAYLRNISEGGVYVETDSELAMGERFRLRIMIDDEDEIFDLDVEVVWVNKAPSASSGLRRGVGVAWLNLPPRKKQMIKRIVHRALDEIVA